jgi:hypothetical protein
LLDFPAGTERLNFTIVPSLFRHRHDAHNNISNDIVLLLQIVSLKLLDAGYEYLMIDDGWEDTSLPGCRHPNGSLATNTDKFPGGMGPVIEYIHSRELKAGLWFGVSKTKNLFGGLAARRRTCASQHVVQGVCVCVCVCARARVRACVFVCG